MTEEGIDELVAALADSTRAESPQAYPTALRTAANPGLYSWWGDDHARRTLATGLGVDSVPPLLYAGQADATKWPSGKRSNATLRTRIGQQHIRGNSRSSTFRLTISSVLLAELDLQPASSGRLAEASNRVVSDWIANHLRIATVPFPDRDRLGVVEAVVVARLEPAAQPGSLRRVRDPQALDRAASFPASNVAGKSSQSDSSRSWSTISSMST
jgi:hypothetical protein